MDRSRDIVTPSISCSEEYLWMQNSFKQDPCMVAGYLQSECGSGNWVIVPISPGSHYTPPFTNATGCQCSWAAYNTLQACAACQYGDTNSILSWPEYKTNCTGLISTNDYYPENEPIPNETAIPIWAIQNPESWSNQIFNTSQAQTLAAQDNGEITQDSRKDASVSRSSWKHTEAGEIAGGVVGGSILIVVLASIAFYFRKRKNLKNQSQLESNTSNHSRSTSEGTIYGVYRHPHKYHSIKQSYRSVPPTTYNPTSIQPYPYDVSLLNGLLAPPPDALRSTHTNTTMTKQITRVSTPIAPSISDAVATINNTLISSELETRVHEPVESAIHPFIVPPILPEPMDTDNNTMRGKGSPRIGTETVRATRRQAENEIPPAYSPQDDGPVSSAGGSEEVQLSAVTLSGTTLIQDISTRRAERVRLAIRSRPENTDMKT